MTRSPVIKTANAWDFVVKGGYNMAGCKCKKCQANLSTAKAYRVDYGKNDRKYFCNEEHYNEWIQEQEEIKKKQEYDKQMKDRFYYAFCDILGVKGITHTALWKEKAEINAVFPDELVAAYLEENKEWIKEAVSKLSGGIYGKIRYVSAILKNKLGDYVPKIQETPKQPVIIESKIDDSEDAGLRINKKKKTERRRGFAEMDGEV